MKGTFTVQHGRSRDGSRGVGYVLSFNPRNNPHYVMTSNRLSIQEVNSFANHLISTGSTELTDSVRLEHYFQKALANSIAFDQEH